MIVSANSTSEDAPINGARPGHVGKLSTNLIWRGIRMVQNAVSKTVG